MNTCICLILNKNMGCGNPVTWLRCQGEKIALAQWFIFSGLQIGSLIVLSGILTQGRLL